MDKAPDAFRTISEVADALTIPAHVLRFWESRFPQIKPVKRAGGRRYYRPTDVALIGGIRRLLHDEGMTIRGVQKILREQGVRHVAGLGEAGAALPDAFDRIAPAQPQEREPAEIVDFAQRSRTAAAEQPPAPAPEPAPPAPDQPAFDLFSDPPQPAPEPAAAAELPEAWLPTLLRGLPPGAVDNRQARLLPLSIRLSTLRDQMAAAGAPGRR